IIDSISKNGGHLASSLGVVELTIALLLSLDLPKDKVIWDVGHQSYAYKILTDRKEAFTNIRNFGGISGFPKRKESVYDSFDSGHSSTSISAGLGLSVARNLNGGDNIIVSVIGDGALTGGEAFEAIDNLGKLKKNYIVILNDNEMSISKSTGGVTHALLGLRTSIRYNSLKKFVKNIIMSLPGGKYIRDFLISIINSIKQLFVKQSGMLFENMDVAYLGPIDGHNIKAMHSIIERAKKLDRAVVIHVKTKKGKGYRFAEEDPVKFHGVGPFDKNTGEVLSTAKHKSYTKVFGEYLCELAKDNKDIVAITAAMPDGTGLVDFSKLYKDRFFDVGISEQHAVTFAAGLSLGGKVPIVCVYSSFLQRAYDQIIHDVCLQNLHVVFCIDRAGLVGKDGETHQGIFDNSYLSSIPNMISMAPKNAEELKAMLKYAIEDIKGPVSIRYPRGESYEELKEYDAPIKIGKSEVLYDGDKVVLYALGSMVSTAVHIREKLKKKNIDVGIVNARFIKPFDCEMIDKMCDRYKHIVIMEESVERGGLGENIRSYILSRKDMLKNIPHVDIVAIPDCYVEHGDVSRLRVMLGIDSDSIIKKYLYSYVL
ncbi:MAG: 1-deoxy-D-xylulose-5-phosphate synthase, partial [Lachnospiraceae bacterium]|nr:1-deoxy-D-xylulose-5-phosphate synthase [Lachnospiraceae bacterium]